MDERLAYVLSGVTDWLKFAEAKNAVLLTLVASAVAAVIGWTGSDPGPPAWILPYLHVGLAMMVASAVISLISFLPVLSFNWLKLNRKHGSGDSVLFFGHIAGSKPATYLEALRAASGAERTTATRLEIDYATQIVVNAGIAIAKFRLFNYGALAVLAAVLVAVVGCAIHLVF